MHDDRRELHGYPTEARDTLPSQLESLLVAVLDRPEMEQDAAVEELCREHSAHAAGLWRALAVLRRASASVTGRSPSPAAFLGRLEQIGPYRILAQLGQGGAGSVYSAEHVHLGRRVALKTIRPDYLDSQVARLRFRREMIALTRLEHPNICRVYEVGEDQGVPYMALQHVEGEDLGRLIYKARRAAASGDPAAGLQEHQSLPESDDIVLLFEKVARALHVAHGAGLVHRDIKPGNIMVTPGGEPVVLDFGLARAVGLDDAPLSRSGDILGTIEYMAPEQASGRTALVDHRSDVYALGASLYEALVLDLPFPGQSRQETLELILRSEAMPLERRGVSRDLALVVAKAMSKESGRRYQTALELAEDLRRIRAHEPVQARRIGILGRLERWIRRNPLPAALIATFAIGLAASSWQYLRAEANAAAAVASAGVADDKAGEAQRRKQDADAALADMTAVNEFWSELLKSPNPDEQGKEVRFVSVLKQGARLADLKRLPPLPEARVRQRLGETLGSLGQSRDAVIQLQRAEDLFRNHSLDPRDLASVLRALGELHDDLKASADAERCYQQAVELWRGSSGADDQETIGAEQDLARFHARSDRDQGLRELLQVLAHAERALSDNHRITLTIRENVAFLLREEGKPAEAEPLLRRALAVRQALNGPVTETLTTMSNLGAALYDQGKLDDALALFQEAWERRVKVLGPAHSSTVLVGASLMATLVRLGRLEEAEKLGRQIADEAGRNPDRCDDNILNLRCMLATTVARLHRDEEADGMFTALARDAAATAAIDPHVGEAIYHSHGELLTRLHRFEDAEQALMHAVELCKQVGDQGRLAAVRAALVRVYQAWGKPTEAGKWR